MSCIGWVQVGGAWALRVLPFQICPRVCLLLMCLPQLGDSPSAFPGLSCGLSFGLSLQLEAGPRMIMGFIFLWPIFGFLYYLPRWLVIPAVMAQSYWTPFWAGRFIPFLSGLSQVLFCFFLLMGSYVPLFSFFLLGIHGPFANPFELPRPVC